MMRPVHTNSSRRYRRQSKPGPTETAFQVVVEETDLWIVAREDLSLAVHEHVRTLRGELKGYILCHPEFGKSLAPVPAAQEAPALVRDMARGAAACSVGPMAAVAGTIAQHVADRFASQSPDILVENGGDLYLHSTRERTIGLLPDPEQDAALGLALKTADFPLALCASSSFIGHSLSLGAGDLVVVRSRDGALADAAATALCNILREQSDLNRIVDQAKKYSLGSPEHSIDGVFAQCGGKIAVWGAMELTSL